jgi:hypothetical protein
MVIVAERHDVPPIKREVRSRCGIDDVVRSPIRPLTSRIVFVDESTNRVAAAFQVVG